MKNSYTWLIEMEIATTNLENNLEALLKAETFTSFDLTI